MIPFINLIWRTMLIGGLVSSFSAVGRAAPAATAHNPQYADTSFWPAKLEADRAAYAKESWAHAKVLVWAGTGTERGGRAFPQIDEEAIENLPIGVRRAANPPPGALTVTPT
jgi:hypothetical protein